MSCEGRTQRPTPRCRVAWLFYLSTFANKFATLPNKKAPTSSGSLCPGLDSFHSGIQYLISSVSQICVVKLNINQNISFNIHFFTFLFVFMAKIYFTWLIYFPPKRLFHKLHISAVVYMTTDSRVHFCDNRRRKIEQQRKSPKYSRRTRTIVYLDLIATMKEQLFFY
jgi:hypothetical protein